MMAGVFGAAGSIRRLPSALPSALTAALTAPSGSLRTRLLAAFLAIILLTLLSAGSAVVWVVQGYRTRLDVDHLRELSFAAAGAGRQLERQDARPEEIAAFVASLVGRSDVRVLVLDQQGAVVAERPLPNGGTDVSFVGRRLEIPVAPPKPAGGASPGRAPASGRSPLAGGTLVWTDPTLVPGRPHILVSALVASGPGSPGARNPAAESRPEGLERSLGRQTGYRVVLAIPKRQLASAWRELTPNLGAAALLVLPISAAVAWWLSRSITSRLEQITRAAQAMARGNLRQSIPVQGSDEVAQLATAFNAMAQEVAETQRQLREFLANASHELRTPLTSVQGFSQALIDQALPGPDGALEAGQIIFEESERMRRLVEDLLYLSRVESDERPRTRGAVDVATLLREAMRRLHVIAEQHGLVVRADVPDLPLIQGDADELDRLFGNLLDNAGKYTPPGGTVTARATNAGDHLTITVHNTGSVIPTEDLPHVFERFYRVDKSRARDIDGSGLGLAIAHEVAVRHDGAIDVTSEAERGTAFTVTLPLAGPAAPAADPAAGGRPGDVARPAPAAAIARSA